MSANPHRDPALWPKRGDGGKTREGWNPLADGPMPEDTDTAWRLWNALRKAEDGHDEAAIARALEAYKRYMGRWEPAPVHVSKPIDDVLSRLLARELEGERNPERIAKLEELIGYERKDAQKPLALPPGLKTARDARWYMLLADAGDTVLCRECAPKPLTGPRAIARNLYAMESWHFEADEVPTCDRCGKQEVRP